MIYSVENFSHLFLFYHVSYCCVLAAFPLDSQGLLPFRQFFDLRHLEVSPCFTCFGSATKFSFRSFYRLFSTAVSLLCFCCPRLTAHQRPCTIAIALGIPRVCFNPTDSRLQFYAVLIALVFSRVSTLLFHVVLLAEECCFTGLLLIF